VESRPTTDLDAQFVTERKRKGRRELNQFNESHVCTSKKTIGFEATKPTINTNILPHFQTLESHNALPSNQRPYYVKDFLGHKELRDTEIYVNIERTISEPSSDVIAVKIAEKPEDVQRLLEVGFEYVCEKDNLIFLRKRK
jgi:hypothetical protein